MKVTFDKITFEETSVTSARMTDMQELRHLIGGDITISFGAHSETYDEVCVSDFAVTLAEAVVGYITSLKPGMHFFSPDFQDVYSIKITGKMGESCAIYLRDELIADGMPLFTILEGARDFLNQVRPLLQERYGHIEHFWDVYLIPVF